MRGQAHPQPGTIDIVGAGLKTVEPGPDRARQAKLVQGRWSQPMHEAANIDHGCLELVTELVEGVLDGLEAVGERAHAAADALHIPGARNVDRTERRLLHLHRPLAGTEGPAERLAEQRVLEQGLGDLADRLLATRLQSALVFCHQFLPDRCNATVQAT